jgi:TonB family protein
MNPGLLFGNLVSWSAQVAVLVGVAALAALTLKHPRARLLFWQGVLAIAVLLPVIQPWHRPPAPVEVRASGAFAPAYVMAPEPPSRQSSIWRWDYLLPVLAAGAAVRLMLLAIGIARLNRRRREAEPLMQSPIPFQPVNVRWYISHEVNGPATFGLMRPSILLPARFFELPRELREAIASHELIHVLRRDWLATIAGEIVRSAMWFHPAIWYVLSQVQLAREQVVDFEVVRLTRDRRCYLDALVAAAAQSLQPESAPAPLFLKKRQLAARVAAILKENSMSVPRFVTSMAAAGSVAVASAVLGIWLFPIEAPAQSAKATPEVVMPADGAGVLVDAGARLMHRNPVYYPHGAKSTGMVLLEASVSSSGEVTDVRVLSGPEDLRKGAIQNVLQWHYSTTGGLPPTVRVAIQFNQAPAQQGIAKGSLVQKAPVELGRITAIDISNLPEDAALQVRDRIGVHVGDSLMSNDIPRISAIAREIDDHIVVGFQTNSRTDGPAQVRLRIGPPISGVVGGVSGGVVGGVISGTVGGVPGTPTMSPVPDDGVQRVRVGAGVQASNLVNKVVPLYPPLAKQARIEGVVQFNVIIARDGTVSNLTLISGHPLLVAAATDAVKQWVYKPTLLNGQPVEVITNIDVNFTLSQ